MAAAAWVRFPVSADAFFLRKIFFARVSKKKLGCEARGIRTPNLWVWNPTRCHCAIASATLRNLCASGSNAALLFNQGLHISGLP